MVNRWILSPSRAAPDTPCRGGGRISRTCKFVAAPNQALSIAALAVGVAAATLAPVGPGVDAMTSKVRFPMRGIFSIKSVS